MVILLTIFYVLICLFLIVVVLLQSGKAADLAGAFGGMGSQTAFGPRGSATVLSRATTVAAAIFMLTSLTLAIMATRNSASNGSVLEKQKAPVKTTATPATPAPSTAPNGNTTVPLPGIPAAPIQAAPAQAAPGQAAPGQAAPSQGGQPSLTVIRPDGTKTTTPIKLPPAPGNQPPAGKQQPAPKK